MNLHCLSISKLEVAIRDWGEASLPVVFAAHGMGGRSDNFDLIAHRLRRSFRLVAVDFPGRGLSQWSKEPERDYCFESYEAVVKAALDQLEIDTVHWLGVSLGGALGIHLASGVLAERIKSLIINDVGPTLPEKVATAIHKANSSLPELETFSEYETFYQTMLRGFGMQDSERRTWRDMARIAARRTDNGRWTFHFDPAVADHLVNGSGDFEQWNSFAAIKAPILLFRGGRSDLLTPEILSDMVSVQPQMKVVEIDGVGHAPLLDRKSDLNLISRFLLRAESIATVRQGA